ncbi:hypothetical protein FRB90_009640 [Tulasnella sp. 427]|nr:hypothetical protein FRB90_009640 [Tulasnella sp. 427]
MAPSTRHTAASQRANQPADPAPEPPVPDPTRRRSKRKSPAEGNNDGAGTNSNSPPPQKVQKGRTNRSASAQVSVMEPPPPPPDSESIATDPPSILTPNTARVPITDASSASAEVDHVNLIEPAASASQATSESAEELASRNAALEKEVRNLKKYKVLWAKQQGEKTALAQDQPSDGSIPRPPGERGKNGWNMQTALQLETDGDMYNAILATIRDAVRQAGLDWRIKFDEQEPARLGAAYSQVKRVHPYLKRFKSDWACRELVLAALQNRRKTESAKLNRAAKSPTKKPPAKSKRTGFKPRSKSAVPTTSTAGPSNEGASNLEEILEED